MCTALTAFSCSFSSGYSTAVATVESDEPWRPASHTPAPMATTATTMRISSLCDVIASTRVSGGAPCTQPPASRDREHDGADRQQRRHQCDVENFQPRAEPLDLDVEAATHVAQLLADAHALLLEAVQLGFLLGREHERAGRTAACFELRQLALGLLQLGVEFLLLRAQLLVGVAAQVVHLGERPEEALAAADADQVAAAREVVDRVRDEVAVVRPRRREVLPEHVLRSPPQRIGK